MRAHLKTVPFTEKRLAKLLRQGALAHIRRDYSSARALLSETTEFLNWAGRMEWEQGAAFVTLWREAVSAEERGEAVRAAPAAWIHLSQEMASILESGGDWIGHLSSRWKVAPGRISIRKRLLYGISSVTVFALCALFFALMARNLAEGHLDWLTQSPWTALQERTVAFLLILLRVAGAVWMIEHGFSWGKRALTGRANQPLPFFLPENGGPSLLK